MHYRAIFISDVHLGTKASNAKNLLEFLKNNDADTIYLVGDIIDGWALKRKIFWTQDFNDVIQKILRKVRKGTKVVWIRGNHDEMIAPFIGQHFGGVEIAEQAIHVTADNKRFLVIHGDQFDNIVRYHKWIALLGCYAYDVSVTLNCWFNVIRNLLGLEYWSLSQYLKHKVKEAGKFIENFKISCAHEAEVRGMDGVICGHIHFAEITTMPSGIIYINDGCWTENCTAVVEDYNGEFKILELGY